MRDSDETRIQSPARPAAAAAKPRPAARTLAAPVPGGGLLGAPLCGAGAGAAVLELYIYCTEPPLAPGATKPLMLTPQRAPGRRRPYFGNREDMILDISPRMT